VGCGQGTQALRLAELGYEVVGVDHSSAMLSDFERALAGRSKDVRRRVHLVEGDAIRLPRDVTTRGRFDVILCHGVLMYLPAPGPALAEMCRVLTPTASFPC
jgi:SAM-dependent methyltransferase